MMNITNFRELGGIETTDGHLVKSGCFFRSGPVIFPDEESRKDFEALNIKTILDLRSPQECEEFPDEIPAGCTYIPCSAINIDSAQAGNLDLATMMQNGDFSVLVPYVRQVYRDLPFSNKAYGILFDLLLSGDVPVVFHCSAGKDRTGFAAYLILKTLGVSDEAAMADYLLSNEYRRAENEQVLARMGNVPGADELLCVKEAHLQSSIDAINEKYEDFSAYLLAEYGITEENVAELRRRYLERKE